MSAVTYDNDASFGTTAPAITALEVIHGDTVEEYGAVSGTCVFFWSKNAKDEYVTFLQFSAMAEEYPDLQVVGINCDAARDDAMGYVGKMGKAMPELSVDELKAAHPLLFDEGRKVRKAFMAAGKLLSIGAGMMFLVDKTGTIVWREQYSRSALPGKAGQFNDQVKHLLAGEPLDKKNGNKPAPVEDSDDSDDDFPEQEVAIDF